MPDVFSRTSPTLQDLRAALLLALRDYALETTTDEVKHAQQLVMGILNYKANFVKLLRTQFSQQGVPVERIDDIDQIAHRTYIWLELSWGRQHLVETPRQYLDRYQPLDPGPSNEEIEKSWEIDIGSSDDYMRKQWDGSARHRKGTLEELGILGKSVRPKHG